MLRFCLQVPTTQRGLLVEVGTPHLAVNALYNRSASMHPHCGRTELFSCGQRKAAAGPGSEDLQSRRGKSACWCLQAFRNVLRAMRWC